MKKGKTIAVVQARMGSKRMCNKIMLCLNGFPIAKWVLHRLKKSKLIDEIVFSIPNTPDNDVLGMYLYKQGSEVYRGSEEDVLDRFYQTGIAFSADTIVRICADNPFVTGSEIDYLIKYYEANNYEYVYNHIPFNNRYPDGLGGEITSMDIIRHLNRLVEDAYQREHLFNYIWDNRKKYKIGTFDPIDEYIAHPEIKLDINTGIDYENMMRLDLNLDSTPREIINEYKLKYHEFKNC